MQKISFIALAILCSCAVYANTESPYSGQEIRAIKALSQQEIDGYLSGQGMGYALAAELNHYPGPRHVLDLAEELALSEQQLRQTQTLFTEMRAKAVELGQQLVAKEKALDQLFASGDINEQALNSVLAEIGELHAQLRYVHLSTHLKQKALLSQHQVHLYDQLRGYDAGEHDGGHQHTH